MVSELDGYTVEVYQQALLRLLPPAAAAAVLRTCAADLQGPAQSGFLATYYSPQNHPARLPVPLLSQSTGPRTSQMSVWAQCGGYVRDSFWALPLISLAAKMGTQLSLFRDTMRQAASQNVDLSRLLCVMSFIACQAAVIVGTSGSPGWQLAQCVFTMLLLTVLLPLAPDREFMLMSILMAVNVLLTIPCSLHGPRHLWRKCLLGFAASLAVVHMSLLCS